MRRYAVKLAALALAAAVAAGSLCACAGDSVASASTAASAGRWTGGTAGNPSGTTRAAAQTTEFVEKDFEPYTVGNFFTLKKNSIWGEYLLHDPGAKKQGVLYPVLVHLHGAGEQDYIKDRPFYSVGGELLSEVMRRINADPEQYESYVVVPVSEGWGPIPYSLKYILEEVFEGGAADTDRVYITGVSMGGFATTDFLFSFPDVAACAVPLSGATYTTDKFESIVDIPMRIFHSEDDNVVSVENSRKFYDNLIKAGGTRAEYTELTGYGHYPYSYVYTATDTIDWMYRQKK